MRTAENRLKAAWKLNGDTQESRQPKKPKPVARVLRWVKARWRTLLAGFLLMDIGACIGAAVAFPLGVQTGLRQEPEPSRAAQRLAEQLIKERASNGM